MNSYDILVIILSSLLAIVLVIAVIAGIYIAKFAKNLKEISDKAKELVDDASSVAATMKKAAAPTVVAKFVAEQISNAVKNHGAKSKKED